MFEKEAEEYFENECLHSYADTEEELKEDVVAAFKSGAEFGYNKANEYAKTIIQDLLDNSDEYARERAINFLEEKNDGQRT